MLLSMLACSTSLPPTQQSQQQAHTHMLSPFAPAAQQYPQQGYGAGAPPPAGGFNGYEQKPGGPPGYPPQGAAYGYPPQAAYGVPQYPPQAAYPPQQQQYGYQQQAAAPGYVARPPQDPEAAMGAGYAAPDAAMASAMAFAETKVRNAFVRKVRKEQGRGAAEQG